MPEIVSTLHISDIHMSNALPGARVGLRGVTDRLKHQKNLWGRVYNDAEKFGVSAIFIQGDLFDHSKVDAITLKETFESLSKPPAPVYVIAGNHDGVNVRGERFTVEALEHIEGFRYHEWLQPIKLRPWLIFHCMEYATLEQTKSRLASIEPPAHATNVLLMHNSIDGCKHAGWTCEDGLDPSALDKKFDFIVSGHFHDPQDFGKKGMYLGAPMHHHFGDAGRQAGYWVMKWRKSKPRPKRIFVDGGCPRFHVSVWPDLSFEDAKPGDYVKVKVRCGHAELPVFRGEIEAQLSELMSIRGLMPTWVHEAVYHHVKRLSPSGEEFEGVMRPKKMVRAYVESAEVDTGSLSEKDLLRAARKIMKKAALHEDD